MQGETNTETEKAETKTERARTGEEGKQGHLPAIGGWGHRLLEEDLHRGPKGNCPGRARGPHY